ncbi:MAG: hypothetical protein RL113_63 [Pseudomonadota bacterium]
MGNEQMEMYTQYIYEKRWQKITSQEALRIIAEEMPETDQQSTLAYIMDQLGKGKVVTLGECRFGTKKIIG